MEGGKRRGESFLTAEGDGGFPAGQCEAQSLSNAVSDKPTSQDGSLDYLTHFVVVLLSDCS